MTKATISCFTNSYGRFGGEAALAHLAEAGVKWMELPIRTANAPGFFGDVPLITTAATSADVKELKTRIADAGLGVSSCNVTSGNPLEPEILELTKRKLDVAKMFGVTLVVGGAGEFAIEAESETLFGHLRQIGEHARELDLVYCFETHPGICVSPDSMLEAMERFDHPHLKLNFDTGNVLYYNEGIDVLSALRKVRDHVRHVHLKDSNGKYRDWHFPALGAGGAVDFAGVKGILDEVHFDGPYSLEIEGIEGEGELSLADYKNRIEQSVAHLNHCGFC